MTKGREAVARALTWGDVMCAAIDVCQTVGKDEPVSDEYLVTQIRAITEITGGVKGAYSKPSPLFKEPTNNG